MPIALPPLTADLNYTSALSWLYPVTHIFLTIFYRETYETAKKPGLKQVTVIVHNHPSGDPTFGEVTSPLQKHAAVHSST
jgi:hypothetical protein